MHRRPLVLSLALLLTPACQRPAAEEPSKAAEAPAPVTPPSQAPTQTQAPATPAPTDAAELPGADEKAAPPADPQAPVAAAADAPAERPFYYERKLELADLEGRTLRELTLMRNTIYARAGQEFRKPWLDAYFRAQTWYEPRDAPDLTTLTEYDFENARAIVDHESALKRSDLEARQAALLAKKKAGPLAPGDDVELELLATHLGGWTGEGKPDDLSPLADPDKLEGLLAVTTLDTMSLRELRLLRNTIYARRGRVFRSILLMEYFGGIAWYTPDEAYTDAKLTATDRKNIRLISSVEKAAGGPLTDYEHKVEDGWMYAA